MWTLVLCSGLACVGVLCAGGAGVNGWKAFDAWRCRERYRTRVRDSVGTKTGTTSMYTDSAASSFDRWVIERMKKTSTMLSLGHGIRLIPQQFVRTKWLSTHAKVAGITDEVTAIGFCETRLRMALGGMAIGAIIGSLFSVEFSLLLMAVGAVFGWQLAARTVNRRIRWRASEMERHLPEMLDVVSLGMRSGLSFDRSLSLYVQHFDTLLSCALGLAQTQWMCGLATRDEALRQVAASYDSVLFGRVVESIIRALRFGSSMVEGLEAASVEARAAYRASKQEQVAKAPVKMMIPTGALILPAMLILVLGPVLLEMVGGF